MILERAILDEAERARWLRSAREAAERGFKVIGLGCAAGDQETGLQFLGFVTLWDPPRPAALGAVREAHAAGITVMMLTGDHPATALAIAASVGIVSPRALTGAEIEQMTERELNSSLREVRVFSRLLPEHKLRIVAALQLER